MYWMFYVLSYRCINNNLYAVQEIKGGQKGKYCEDITDWDFIAAYDEFIKANLNYFCYHTWGT